MKFGKNFQKQKVPEWIEAYVDYNGLKHVLREIRKDKQNRQPSSPLTVAQQRLTLQRAFSDLNQQEEQQENGQRMHDLEDQVIAIDKVQEENSLRLYDTKFLLSPGKEGRENELTFFKKLDNELNKVNVFYKDKVEEVTKEADLLNKQMDALIALRIKVANSNGDVAGTSSFSKISSMSSPHTKGKFNREYKQFTVFFFLLYLKFVSTCRCLKQMILYFCCMNLDFLLLRCVL